MSRVIGLILICLIIYSLKINEFWKIPYNVKNFKQNLVVMLIIDLGILTIFFVNTLCSNDSSKDLYSDNRPDLNNLDYITKTLELRQAIIDKGGLDPFVPIGHKVSPTANDFEAAERVANVLQECVDEANGDSQTFTAALQRRII